MYFLNLCSPDTNLSEKNIHSTCPIWNIIIQLFNIIIVNISVIIIVGAIIIIVVLHYLLLKKVFQTELTLFRL